MFSRPNLEVGVIVQTATLVPQPTLDQKGLKTEGEEEEQPPRPHTAPGGPHAHAACPGRSRHSPLRTPASHHQIPNAPCQDALHLLVLRREVIGMGSPGDPLT